MLTLFIKNKITLKIFKNIKSFKIDKFQIFIIDDHRSILKK